MPRRAGPGAGRRDRGLRRRGSPRGSSPPGPRAAAALLPPAVGRTPAASFPRGSGLARRLDVWAGPAGGGGREEGGCTGLQLRGRRRRLQRGPCPPLGASSPQARPRRPVDGGPGLSAEDKEPDLGLIFKKRERTSGKGALRRSGKGWEGSLEKGGTLLEIRPGDAEGN